MSSNDTKYYLRPTGYVPQSVGKSLKQKNCSFEVNGNHFTSIEVIKRQNKKTIKESFNFSEFFKKIVNKNIHIDLLYKNLLKKNNFLKNNLLSPERKYLIFGILNVTPDSFSDGGENLDLENAEKTTDEMIKMGADFIDIGGESTRPGAKKVSISDEAIRVLPLIQRLNYKKIKISLDTRNSSTMEFGLLSGVNMINDVSGLTYDKNSIKIIKKYGVPIILMHMPGNPQTMMKKNKYNNVVLDVYDYLEKQINFCESNGIKRKNIIIDPGIGFGKDYHQNIELINNLSIFHTLNCSIMLGVSRKRFISSISDEKNPKMRLGGTISATLNALMQGIRIHRVHDVKQVNQAVKVFEKLNS